ncbi:uncharacterized protein N7459_005178 [Penicillium hispanicum]|uniref:uncharacterized protein n=1 Tax=Penicillium hispanicum TaxID=1080232 RepID=UPI002541BBC5|nr:uncharacterized protein N7459_005178 [Penicillium hispanicum]KAJ5585378.1 hypothetical protein N7459_005178 [Penicillium hispanicum]
MASGLIFDPIRLLQAAPLATSTGTLVNATLELIMTTTFLSPRLRPQSNAILPRWWDSFFKRGVWTVLALNLGTIATSAATLVLNRERRALQTTAFYWAGLAGAIGHLAFVPFVVGPVKGIVDAKEVGEGGDGDGEDSATAQMAKWVGVHRVRMLVADLPAWVAFVGAVLTL